MCRINEQGLAKFRLTPCGTGSHGDELPIAKRARCPLRPRLRIPAKTMAGKAAAGTSDRRPDGAARAWGAREVRHFDFVAQCVMP